MKTFLLVLRKDSRRLAIPFLLWALVMVASKLLSPTNQTPDGTPLRPLLAVALVCTTVLFAVLTVILAAWTVLEDPPKGTSAFWLTRPLPRGSVVAAKFCLLAVIAVLPVILTLAVLAWFGAGWRALVLAGLSQVLTTAWVPFAVAAFAVTAESFGQFAINAILILIGAGMVAAVTAGLMQLHSMQGHPVSMFWSVSLMASRLLATLVLALVIGVGIVLLGYLRRHLRFVLGVVFLGALAPMMLQIFWKWDFEAHWRELRSGHRTADTDIHFVMHLDVPKGTISSVVIGGLESGSDSSGNIVAPTQISGLRLAWPDGRTAQVDYAQYLSGASVTQYDPAALARALAPSVILNLPAKGVTQFNVMLSSEIRRHLSEEPATIHANVAGAVMRYQVAGELPLKAGATRTWGLLKTEVKDVEASEDGGVLTLRNGIANSMLATALDPETNLRLGGPYAVGPTGGPVPSPLRAFVGGPIYLLVNKSRQEAVLPSGVTDFSSRDFGGYAVETFSLNYSGSGIDDAWLDQAVVVCVRLVDIGTGTGTAESEAVRVPAWER